MDPKVERSAKIISAFVLPRQRARYFGFITGKTDLDKFASRLAHFDDFDPRFIVSVPNSKHTATGIEEALRRLGAPSRCFLLSENTPLNGTEGDLHSVLETVIGYGYGSIICCLPGRLAFFEGEGPSDRYILSRTS